MEPHGLSAAEDGGDPPLTRVLGLWQLSLAGIGIILGAGIYALLAPAGTPAPVVARLAEATAKVAAEPEFQAFLRSVSVEPASASTPERTAEFIRSERAKWEPIIRATGLRIE